MFYYCVLPKKFLWRLRLSCALGLVRSLVRSVLCARLVRIPKCLRASNVLCAVLCGCCARLVRSVRRRLWVWDIFSGGLVRVLCWGLGRKIPPPWAPNTLYLDKVLCVSCAPGAFAKKSLGQPCAECFWWKFFSVRHSTQEYKKKMFSLGF